MTAVDEFLDQYPFPLDPPRRMTDAQHRNAEELLLLLPDMVGHLPVEVVWMLRRVIDGRDAAALALLDDLRCVDTAVRT